MKKNRLVCGVGINDSPYSIHTNSGFCKFYSTWKSMLTRVYCGVHPTYKETEVCTEWLTFSNFKKWMESQIKFYILYELKNNEQLFFYE